MSDFLGIISSSEAMSLVVCLLAAQWMGLEEMYTR